MKKKYFYAFVLTAFTLLPYLSSAVASEVAGKSYYTITFDMSMTALQDFTWSFGPAAGGSTADNATDNATQGEVSISAQAKTFDNATGSYLALGNFFRGTWKATEVNYSSFYEADISTYYSFLFFGVVFRQSSYITGIVYSDTIIKSTAKDTEEIKTIFPYMGILVERSEKRNKILK